VLDVALSILLDAIDDAYASTAQAA
jgi:hypothetical protein